MRSFFNRISEKTLRKIYRVLTVIIAIYLSLFCISFLFFSGERFFYPLKYKEEVLEYSKEFKVDERLIFAVIRVESSFNRRAKSQRGAKGLMQITDKTAEFIAEKIGENEYDLFDARVNVKFGCYYISYLKNKFKNQETVMAAYNAGEGRVMEWLKDSRYSEDGITLKDIPYLETRAYVKKIQKTFEKYRKLYGNILDKSENFE